jgi:tetratricopeptide (TPR) repeat protein
MRMSRQLTAGLGLCITLAAITTTAFAQPRPDLLKGECVLRLPGMDKVRVRGGIPFKTAGDRPLAFDLYLPPGASGPPPPVVVFANGVGDPDPALKDWGIYKSWARLAAVSGMAAVLHNSRQGHAAEDLADLFATLRNKSKELRIDTNDVCVWACSANVQNAMPYAMDPKNEFIKAVVLYYGALDPELIRGDLPLLVGRAGLDVQRFNASIDAYVAKAVTANAPVTTVNLPGGHHAFDLVDDNDASRAVVRQTLTFMRDHLTSGVQAGMRANAQEVRARQQIAAKDWSAALETTQAWVKSQPDSGGARMSAAEALYNLKRYREAGEAYARAGDLGANPALTWYNAACSYALAGEKETAMGLLTRAFGTGRITDREQVRNDPDLESLADDPRFAKLLEGSAPPPR